MSFLARSSAFTSKSVSARLLSRGLSHHQHNHHVNDGHRHSHDNTHAHLSRDDATLIRHQAVHMLKQKLSVLKMLSDEDFVRKNAAVYNSSVASHIRHSLDHFHSILKASEQNEAVADYDTRERNTEIETNREKAVLAVERVVQQLHHLDLTKKIKVSFIGDEHTFQKYTVESHVARELAFASHHAIHHMTTVKLLMNAMDYEFSKESTIGIAPSTVQDLKKKGDL